MPVAPRDFIPLVEELVAADEAFTAADDAQAAMVDASERAALYAAVDKAQTRWEAAETAFREAAVQWLVEIVDGDWTLVAKAANKLLASLELDEPVLIAEA